jgi:hypothetical protein
MRTFALHCEYHWAKIRSNKHSLAVEFYAREQCAIVRFDWLADFKFQLIINAHHAPQQGSNPRPRTYLHCAAVQLGAFDTVLSGRQHAEAALKQRLDGWRDVA